MPLSRRSFLRRSGQAAAAVAAAPWIRTSSASPNEALVVALIGCRGMGFGDLTNHLRQPDVLCGGLCDVDADVLDGRAADVEDQTGKRPPTFSDYRRILDRSDVDAVIIGTPDHWHCLQMTDACSAGKDVYVEKPMANSIGELDAMVAAARRHGRVVQVGQQQRSGAHWREAVDFVQSGRLGDIRQIKVWGFFDYGKGQPRVPNQPPPAHVDFDMWLGPAPDQPFNPSRFHSNWRHQWDFGGGLLTDWGVHLLDIVVWAMGIDAAPRSVSASGGIYTYHDRAIETPDTLSVLYDMGDYTITWEHLAGLDRGLYGRHYGIAFIGNNGTLVVNRAGWEVIAEEREGAPLVESVPFSEGVGSNHEAHAIDFIEAVRERREPTCTVEDGRAAAFLAHLGNVAYRTRSRVVWNEDTGRFAANRAANQLIRPAYRAPWAFPDAG
ncbi:MAG: Gfo/Idh/MocA family oxidoreductase [Rhodothermales bacterium]